MNVQIRGSECGRKGLWCSEGLIHLGSACREGCCALVRPVTHLGCFPLEKQQSLWAQLQGSGWMFHTLGCSGNGLFLRELEHTAAFPLLPKARGDSWGHLGQLLCVVSTGLCEKVTLVCPGCLGRSYRSGPDCVSSSLQSP